MKEQVFPDFPHATVHWKDAFYNHDDEASDDEVRGFGGTVPAEDSARLARIGKDEKGEWVVVLAITRWPTLGKIGHSDAVPLSIVEKVVLADGTLVYEKPKRSRRKEVP